MTKATRLPLQPAKLLKAIKIFLSTLDFSSNLPKIASMFVASAGGMVKRDTYSCMLLFFASAACIAGGHFSNTLSGDTLRSGSSHSVASSAVSSQAELRTSSWAGRTNWIVLSLVN